MIEWFKYWWLCWLCNSHIITKPRPEGRFCDRCGAVDA